MFWPGSFHHEHEAAQKCGGSTNALDTNRGNRHPHIGTSNIHALEKNTQLYVLHASPWPVSRYEKLIFEDKCKKYIYAPSYWNCGLYLGRFWIVGLVPWRWTQSGWPGSRISLSSYCAFLGLKQHLVSYRKTDHRRYLHTVFLKLNQPFPKSIDLFSLPYIPKRLL